MTDEGPPTTAAATERLLLDEHLPPSVASRLRELGFDVIAVAEHAALRGSTDDEVLAFALEQRRRVVTENVKDFRPRRATALAQGQPAALLLLVSPRRHPRRRRSEGALVTALTGWLSASPRHGRPDEDWLG